MTGAYPHSPTWENLKNGTFVLPQVPADPYGTVGVWPDGTTVYWVDGDAIWISTYDRALDTSPQTGVGWTSIQLTAGGHAATVFAYSTATQTRTADISFVDVVSGTSTMSFAVAAGEVWRVEYDLPMTFTGTGGVKFQLTGPASPTAVSIRGYYPQWSTGAGIGSILTLVAPVTAFSTAVFPADAAASSDSTYATGLIGGNVHIIAYIANGSNAGTVTLQVAQNSANGTTVVGIGAMMRAERIGG